LEDWLARNGLEFAIDDSKWLVSDFAPVLAFEFSRRLVRMSLLLAAVLSKELWHMIIFICWQLNHLPIFELWLL
jgi:hypothetical protein